MGSLYTTNLTVHRLWVTIYDLGKTRHLDYGYVEAYPAGGSPQYRQWTTGGYAWPGVYHARAEIKDGNNNTIFDTWIELTGNSNWEHYYAAYLTGDSNGNYWWVSVSSPPDGGDESDPPTVPNQPPVS